MKSQIIAEIEAYFREERKQADAERGREIDRLLDVYRFMPKREYPAKDPIVPSSLVELETGSTTAFYFIAPAGGGLVLRVDGKPVQVLTAQSPLGEALVGHKAGESIQVEAGGQARHYVIRSVC